MRRLVIVADNSLIVEAIRIGFRKSGEFNLLGHADGRTISASAIVEAAPDVVLVDDMEGSERALELVRQVKAESEQINVIVLTVHMNPDWLQQLFAAGALGAISKSIHPIALATVVRETLNGNVIHRFQKPATTNDDVASRLSAQDLPLTARELEILELVAAGASNGDVARQLWVTEQTVKFHLRNIYRKLNVGNRTEASHFAHVNRLFAGEREVVRQRALTVA